MQFGRFCLIAHRRELRADGVSIAIGSRALDVLIALIEARGGLVTKGELISRVWPTTFVEENALQFQISTIRKALGKDRDFIKTISGRGYRFVADITISPPDDDTVCGVSAAQTMRHGGSPARSNIPAPTSDLIGRDPHLAEIEDLVWTHRLVTLAGAGGVGKTRLGIELGRRLLPKFNDGVWLIELAAVTDEALVLPTIAHAIGLPGGPTSLEQVSATLGSKNLLLLLDNCEHMIDAVARVAEALLRASPSLRMIATSQEPLRLHGERVYRVPALDVPNEGPGDIEHARRCGAVTLFLARADMEAPRFALDTRSASAVIGICRQLDGVPLAIELAAARAATMGVEELAARMDDCFELLTEGCRTALRKHRSLRATHDWSYDLLSEPERAALRRITVFAGAFTLPAASAIVDGSVGGESEFIDRLHRLIAKSLVAADLRGAVPHYRLSRTMRAYGREKLAESGEFSMIARRHAEYFRNLLEKADTGQETRTMAERLAAYSAWIDDVHAALDWAFSAGGEATIGVALTAASEQHWLALSGAFRVHAEPSVSTLRTEFAGATRREVQVATAGGVALLHRKNPAPKLVWP